MAVNDPHICAALPKLKGKNSLPRIEFFTGDARSSWMKHGGTADNFKIRVGGTYVTREGEKHSFFNREGLAWFLLHHLSEGMGLDRPEIPAEGFALEPPKLPPSLPVGTKVTWMADEWIESFTRSPVAWDELMETWVVSILGSRKPVPLSEIELRQHRA